MSSVPNRFSANGETFRKWNFNRYIGGRLADLRFRCRQRLHMARGRRAWGGLHLFAPMTGLTNREFHNRDKRRVYVVLGYSNEHGTKRQ